MPHTAQRGEQRVGGRASFSREGVPRGWLGLGGEVELPILQALRQPLGWRSGLFWAP